MAGAQAGRAATPAGETRRLTARPTFIIGAVSSLSGLAQRRLVIVAGKGGVGKSTVTAALAMAAGRAGRQTLVVELAGRSDVARMLGGEPRADLVEAELLPNVHHVTISRQAALRYYLDHEVPGPLPAGRLLGSRMFSAFVEATPGMGELLFIGKVTELARVRRRPGEARSYDLVLLDAPARGQLMALLDAPGTFRAIARMGPVARQTAEIEQLLIHSGRTGVLAVSTPEQMSVSEVLELQGALAAKGIPLDRVVINKTVSWPFNSEEERLLRAAGEDPALRSARWFSNRSRSQRRQIARLRRQLDDPTWVRLPLIFEGIDRSAIEALAGRLRRGAT